MCDCRRRPRNGDHRFRRPFPTPPRSRVPWHAERHRKSRKQLAKQLLASEKEGVEHRIALDDMVARLGPLAENIEAQPEPHVLTLAQLQHLETEIRARLPEGTSALTVLEALHPTPAVCGLPS